MYVLKTEPEDFIVQEDLSIEWSNSGEHLWLLVKKLNLTTDIARSILAKVFAIPSDQISYGGKKDRHAVTEQWFSLRLPGQAPALSEKAQQTLQEYQAVSPLYDGESLEILEARVHQKKCQRGCHRGNFFQIRVQTEVAVTLERYAQSIEMVQQFGFPNYFGEQRFGGEVASIEDVDTLLQGIHRKAKSSRLKPKEAWACSQARAYLFNQVLKARLISGQTIEELQLCALLEGDVMNLVGSQSCFKVDPESAESMAELQQRFLKWDIVPTGPLFGSQGRQLAPSGQVYDIEQSVWASLAPKAQAQLEKLQEMSRRPLLVRPDNIEFSVTDDGIALQFWLQKGSYATECIAHIFKVLETSSAATSRL